MRMNRKLAAGVFGLACLAMAAVPSAALAQARQGGRQGGGGRGMMGGGDNLREVLAAIDLTDDEKAKVKDITTAAQKDMQDARQDMQDMSPQERMEKVQKMQADERGKIADVLTDDQKPKFFNKIAELSVTNAGKRVTAMAAAAAKLDTDDDKKTQAKTMFEDVTKKLDALKPDVEAAKDETTSAAVTKKVTDIMRDVRTGLTDALGQEDARTVMMAGMQGQGGGANGRQGGRRGAAAPTTTPAPQI
jgi:Spy/CpxP family protein refolding chaperone